MKKDKDMIGDKNMKKDRDMRGDFFCLQKFFYARFILVILSLFVFASCDNPLVEDPNDKGAEVPQTPVVPEPGTDPSAPQFLGNLLQNPPAQLIAGEPGYFPSRIGPDTSPDLAEQAVEISAGSYHTCAVWGTGELKCWGRNDKGQLGIGNMRHQSEPVAVVIPELPSDVRFTQVSGGEDFTCAVLSNGDLYCWGNNSFGQLGLGSSSRYNTPQKVDIGSRDAQNVWAGDQHVCALFTNAETYCWGRNRSGELGVAASTDTGRDRIANKDAPTLVSLNQITEMSLGKRHTCAVVSAGEDSKSLRCWGRNIFGQLGRGDMVRIESSSDSSQVGALGSSVREAALGKEFSCALSSDGSVRCWGRNFQGVLGNTAGSDHLQMPPDAPVIASDVQSIAAGEQFVCSLLESGWVKCWGANHRGQLGRETESSNISDTPDLVNLPDRATAITAGNQHACAILVTKKVYCWGWNNYGQLGVFEQSLPVRVSQVHSGHSHTCMLLSNKRLTCWGSNSTAQLGYGDRNGDGMVSSLSDTVNSHSPGYSELNFPEGTSIVSIGGGDSHTCAILTNGRAYCWGWNGNNRMGLDAALNPPPPSDGTQNIYLVPQEIPLPNQSDKVIALDAADYTCLVLSSGIVKCFGTDLSNPLRSLDNQEVRFGDQRAIDVGTGEDFSCALLENGEVHCWGYNNYGVLGYPVVLGRNSIEYTAVPRKVNFPDDKKVLSISVKEYSSCAVLEDGDVYCWGRNDREQLGISNNTEGVRSYCFNYYSRPVDENGNSILSYTEYYDSSSAPQYYELEYYYDPPDAIEESTRGILRTASACDSSHTFWTTYAGPTKVDLDDMENGVRIERKALTVARAGRFSCVILDNRAVRCWGEREEYRSGTVTSIIRGVYTPPGLPAESEIINITAGLRHVCVFLTGGDVHCVGNNLFGQLGIGRFGDNYLTQFETSFLKVRLDSLNGGP